MRPRNQKFVLLQIIFAFAMLILLLMVFIAPQAAAKQNAGSAPVAFAGAAAGAILSLYYALTQLPPPGQLPPVEKFQVNMLVALAGAELVGLLGIFIGARSIGPWPFAIVAWVLILGLVLPRTLRYFRMVESGQTL